MIVVADAGPIHYLILLGERAAIALALAIPADRLLIDDGEGRVEAERRHLRITGTLGVLAEAHQRRLLDFESALSRM